MINRLRSFYFLESRGSRQFVIYKNCLKLMKKRGLGIAHLKRETQHLNKKTWYLTRQEFELQIFCIKPFKSLKSEQATHFRWVHQYYF